MMCEEEQFMTLNSLQSNESTVDYFRCRKLVIPKQSANQINNKLETNIFFLSFLLPKHSRCVNMYKKKP